MDDKAALKRLRLLEGEDGALKIINHFHACSKDLLTDAQIAAAGPHSPIARDCAAYAEKHGHAPGMPGA